MRACFVVWAFVCLFVVWFGVGFGFVLFFPLRALLYPAVGLCWVGSAGGAHWGVLRKHCFAET